MDKVVAEADLITTVTPRAATDGGLTGLFSASAVSPGTHIAAMGADGPGKGELPLLALAAAGAQLYADYPTQSFRVGEFQHLPEELRGNVAAIGDLLLHCCGTGSSTGEAVTVFDSSGIALQDVAAAAAVLAAADVAGLTEHIEF